MSNDDLARAMQSAEVKAALKEAIKEWLNEQVQTFGYWSIKVLAGAALVGIIYLMLISNGWHKG